MLGQASNGGEYYLTDAFQYMIDHGAKLKVLDVAGWYDAGKLDTLLDTNRVMLGKGRARVPAGLEGATIVEPVYIEDGVKCSGATIGPNVSIGAGTVVRNATLRHSIVGSRSVIAGSTLEQSMIGDDAVVEGVHGSVAVGDNGQIRGRTGA